MSSITVSLPSKSAVNRAGDLVARGWRGETFPAAGELLDAVQVIDLWRQSHSEPLAWITEKLAARVGSISGQVVVAQRLKRMPQITKKLARYANMNLARMQDIGGCRVVVAGPEEVAEVIRLIASYGTNRWQVAHVADYRDSGKPDTGYRAVHVIVKRQERLIEIQLRTLRQHSWAEAVERVTALSDHDVKEGRAPESFMTYFRLASDGFYALDVGERPSRSLRDRFRDLHREVGRYVVQAV